MKDEMMLAESPTTTYCNFAARASEWSDSEAIEHLVASGVPQSEARLVASLTPVAFGRTLLDGLGIVFSDTFFVFESDGELVERGTLSTNEAFCEAVNASKSTSAFESIALRSAEVNAINSALNAGSNPEDLVAAPVVIFLNPPTDDGRKKIRRLIDDHLRGPRTPLKKPWWKLF